MQAHSLLFSKRTKGAARLNVPIRRTNRYQQYYKPSQLSYCGRVLNLIHACDVQSVDYKMYISTPPSPEVENFEMKIYYPRSNPGPAGPEADMLPSEPAWQASNVKCILSKRRNFRSIVYQYDAGILFIDPNMNCLQVLLGR